MSEYIEIESDDISIDLSEKTILINFEDNDFGTRYFEIDIDILENKIKELKNNLG